AVCCDAAIWVCSDAGGFYVQSIGVGDASGSHQQQFGVDLGAVGQLQPHGVGVVTDCGDVVVLGRSNLRVQADVPPLPCVGGERLGYVGVFVSQHGRPARDHCDVDAERRKDMGELGCNESATKNRHRARQA